MLQTRDFLCCKQDMSCVPSRTFLVFQARHFMCSKQDISCVPGKTLFQARHFLCSQQGFSCVPSKTFLVFQARHSCVPSRTFPVFQPGQSWCSKRKWLKNREDGSDFHDFLTESIASIRSSFSKIFASSKNFSRRPKKIAPSSWSTSSSSSSKFYSDARVAN